MSPAPWHPFCLPGDIFFTRSSSLLGRLIRWAETDPGEEKTWANHVGLFTSAGYLSPFLGSHLLAWVVESLWHTKHWSWWEGHRKEAGNTIRVYRYRRWESEEQLLKVVGQAKKFVGDRYGWWKLFAHLADRAIFKGKKTISNALRVDSRPICSYTAAKSFAAGGVFFGNMEPEAADPDEMMDHCINSPDWFFVGEFVVPEVKK